MTKNKPIAVVDTNVLVDLYSWHDFHEHFERMVTWASSDPVRLDDAQSRMRIARAREALLLAIRFHKLRASTFSISEAVRVVTRSAEFSNGKPLGDDERAYREAFIKTFLWFVRERLLAGWDAKMLTTDAKGNDADDLLLAYAKENSVPLITNEGYTATGINRKNRMQRLAKEAGVTIVKAVEFCRDDIDSQDEARAFLRAFREETPRYLKHYLKRHSKGRQGIHRILKDLDRYYDVILSSFANSAADGARSLLTYRQSVHSPTR